MRPHPLETADLVIFTGEILNEKLHFLFSVLWLIKRIFPKLISKAFSHDSVASVCLIYGQTILGDSVFRVLTRKQKLLPFCYNWEVSE